MFSCSSKTTRMFLSKTRTENRTVISGVQHSVVYTNYQPQQSQVSWKNKENNKKKNKLLSSTISPNWNQAVKTRWLHPHSRETEGKGRTRTISHLHLQQPLLLTSVFPDCQGKPILPSHSLAEAPTAPGSVIIWADTTLQGPQEPGNVCSSLQWQQEMGGVTRMNNERKT